jgi:hypothetical protein
MTESKKTEFDVLVSEDSVSVCDSVAMKTTGEVQGIFIQKNKRRAKQQVLDITFVAGPAAVESIKKAGRVPPTVNSSASAAAPSKAAAPAPSSKGAAKGEAKASAPGGADLPSVFSAWRPGSRGLVETTTEEILDDVLLPALPAELREAFREAVKGRMMERLTMFSNTTFTNGMLAKQAAQTLPSFTI